MNAFSTIDIDALAPEVSLATIETLTPAIVFVPGGVEKIVSKLEAEVRAIPRDISTAAGRNAVTSLAYKVARTKTGLDDMGKDLVAGIKKQAGLIDADRRIIRDRLDALRDEVRADLTAYEEAEEARVNEHEAALVSIIESPRFAATVPSANLIGLRIAEVGTLAARDWQEFKERGEAAAVDALAHLQQMLAAAIQAEADAAELAMLRRQRVEREEADRIAAEAAQRAEQEAARKIELDRIEAARTEQYQAMRLEAQAQAARDAEAAAARAVEDERKRVAAAQAAEEAAERKRQANKRHRTKINSEALEAIEKCGASSDVGINILEAIAAGRIPHVSITY